MAISSKQDWELMNPILAQQFNALQNNPTNTSSMIKNITLQIGVNVINHKLNRTLQGWIITDQTAAASIYRSAPFNSTTLTLTSNSIVTITLEVF